MNFLKTTGLILVLGTTLIGCKEETKTKEVTVITEKPFEVEVEQFADIKVLRYQIPGWEKLSLKEQKLVYYLVEAGISGRDISWDQNYKYNLTIRKALENIYTNYQGNKSTEDWKNFEIYLKRVWFSNGIHHHYSTDKIKPDFSPEYFNELKKATNTELSPEITAILFKCIVSNKFSNQGEITF